MEINILDKNISKFDLDELRKKHDCVMFDQKKIQTGDNFQVLDESFNIRRQPLRLAVISLSDLDRNWIILNDRFKRNTMIIAADDEVRDNPDVVRFLDSQGVALLMTKRNEDGLLSFETLLKSLTSLKFKSILIEDKIDLLKEFH